MSENVKHTPGPWEACERGDYGDDGIVILGDDMRIAVVNRDEDAALIAAAPELLEALHVVGMSAGWQYMTMETRALVEGAIAKAEARP